MSVAMELTDEDRVGIARQVLDEYRAGERSGDSVAFTLCQFMYESQPVDQAAIDWAIAAIAAIDEAGGLPEPGAGDA